jgi:DNA-binding Lrp family transcriptional regulator
MKLKEKDLEFLDLLRTGKTVKEISQKLQLPQSTVYYHYNKLKRKGFIKGLKVEIDYHESSGYEKALILVSLNNVHTVDFDQFFHDLKGESIIQEVYEVSGDWDFIFLVNGPKANIINFVHEKLQNIQNIKKIQSIFIMKHIEI